MLSEQEIEDRINKLGEEYAHQDDHLEFKYFLTERIAQLEAEVVELREDVERISELVDEADGWSGNLGA